MSEALTRPRDFVWNFHDLGEAINGVESESDAIDRAVDMAKVARQCKSRVFFIGNGGSAAIASHMAADWLKNGQFAAMCFNDGASLTCHANDLGYERVFSNPLKLHGRMGDLLFAISSSGRSLSILEPVWQAKKQEIDVITLSGFDPDNPLREEGAINFYVPSHRYGTVEITHLAILHAILDRVIDG